MVAVICPSCAVAMTKRQVDGNQFEQCPKCGGSWFEFDQFERVASSAASASQAKTSHDRHYHDRQHHDGDHIGLSGFGLPRMRTIVKVAMAGAAALCLIIGLVGYFVVRPLWSQASTTAKAIVAQDIPSSVEQLKRQAGTLLGPQAKEVVGQAASSVEDASKKLRERLGAPMNTTSASEKETSESPKAAETE